MAAPIKRSGWEAVEETGVGAVKGAAAGIVLPVLPAVALGLSAVVASTVGFPIIAGIAWGLAAVTGVVGVSAAIAGAPLLATVGALFGGARAVDKVGREGNAYVAKVREQQENRDADIIAARNDAMQEGFAAGAQEGRKYGQQEGAQMVMAKLQEHAAQQQHASHETHGKEHHAQPKVEHAHDDAASKSFVAAENQRRAEAAKSATAGVQVG